MSSMAEYFRYLKQLPKTCKHYEENERRCLFFDFCCCDGTDEACDQYRED